MSFAAGDTCQPKTTHDYLEIMKGCYVLSESVMWQHNIFQNLIILKTFVL